MHYTIFSMTLTTSRMGYNQTAQKQKDFYEAIT